MCMLGRARARRSRRPRPTRGAAPTRGSTRRARGAAGATRARAAARRRRRRRWRRRHAAGRRARTPRGSARTRGRGRRPRRCGSRGRRRRRARAASRRPTRKRAQWLPLAGNDASSTSRGPGVSSAICRGAARALTARATPTAASEGRERPRGVVLRQVQDPRGTAFWPGGREVDVESVCRSCFRVAPSPSRSMAEVDPAVAAAAAANDGAAELAAATAAVLQLSLIHI